MTPTNLITGFLGVGKTTSIVDLLRRKSTAERWAVIVNEYGEVGIDGALLEDAGGGDVEIQEVAGGCVCCTSAVHFRFALAQVLEQAKPDRLLIETTGVGHPAKLLEDLRSPAYQQRLDVRATIGLLAPDDFLNPEMFRSEVFRDQIELADVLVMNKADRLQEAHHQRFLTWASELYPTKLHVAIVEQGQLDPSWLDLGADHTRQALFPEAHADHVPVDSDPILTLPGIGRPVRKEAFGPGGRTCGWIFSPREVFDEDALMQYLCQARNILRLKGIFRTPEGWLVIQRAQGETMAYALNHSRDSRLEVFAMGLPDGGWISFEQALLQCRLPMDSTS